MAPSLYARVAERGFARSFEQIPPQAGDSPFVSTTAVLPATFVHEQIAATSSAPAMQAFTSPPRTVKALAGAITVLGIIVFGIIGFQLSRWRHKRLAASRSAYEHRNVLVEKRSSLTKELYLGDFQLGHGRYPSKAVLLPPVPPTPDLSVGWKPQIRATEIHPSAIPGPKPAKKRASRCPRIKEKFRQTMSSLSNQMTPPPSYIIANRSSPLSVNGPPSSAPRMQPLPPFPPPESSLPEPPSDITPEPESRLQPKSFLTLSVIPTPEAAPAPMVSPMRIDSNKAASAPADIKGPKSGGSVTSSSFSSSGHSSTSSSSRRLPRLVKVVNTFPPSQPDELKIKVGDVLRLHEEYEDEWCMVQRVGRHDAEKGVIPRFCIEDRTDVIPSTLPLGANSSGSVSTVWGKK
ncbi:hypothetical protein BD410DRAFT_66665 [Rickenella mellea]|uniref:SH3 domain-containing protein n=1 Tax=Rickenella mellea TaxID=50990 RepID=A0A4Y7QBZ0_9AGAM|nr:hypothetical protein BD410DRAFT_66665 [Rickenella mellea]